MYRNERNISRYFILSGIITLFSWLSSFAFAEDSPCEPAQLTVCPDTVIEAGASCTLWAQGADFYVWSPAASLSNPSAAVTTASPVTTTTYTVSGYMQDPNAVNLVVNGDFDQLNQSFTSDLTYYPAGFPWGASGNFTIGHDANIGYGGSGNFMIVDGATQPDATVWQQTIAVVPHSVYTFEASVMSIRDSEQFAQYASLQLSINGQNVSAPFQSLGVLDQWDSFSGMWYSGEEYYATLRIVNLNTSADGNDFGLDHIVFKPVLPCEATASVTVTVDEIFVDVYDTVCENELPYVWNNNTYVHSGTSTYTCPSASGADSTTILHLTVLPAYIMSLSATIEAGETYQFGSRVLTESGVYCDTLPSPEGCDSLICLTLEVLPADTAWEVWTSDVCSDDSLTLHFWMEDMSNKFFSLHFGDDAASAGYADLMMQPVEESVALPLPVLPGQQYTLPGRYTAEVILHFDTDPANDKHAYIVFEVRYAADSIITQRWGDFLSVRTSAYNSCGGFSDYQWYENDSILPGQTGSQLYLPETGLNMNSTYSLEFTRDADGLRMRTCDFFPRQEPQTVTLTVAPTVVHTSAPEQITVETTVAGQLCVYNQSGIRLDAIRLDVGTVEVDAPSVPGLYMMILDAENGTRHAVKFIVE